MIGRLALAALLLGGCAGTQEKPAVQAQQVDGIELRCAAGDTTVGLGRSKDVQVLELWATWCQPCVKALPLWNELARKENLAILAVSIDDEREAPLLFAAEHGIDLPILWDPFGQQLAQAVRMNGVVPTTLVVDCAGAVRHVHEGFSSGAVVDEVAAQARALRQESTCTATALPPECAP